VRRVTRSTRLNAKMLSSARYCDTHYVHLGTRHSADFGRSVPAIRLMPPGWVTTSPIDGGGEFERSRSESNSLPPGKRTQHIRAGQHTQCGLCQFQYRPPNIRN